MRLNKHMWRVPAAIVALLAMVVSGSLVASAFASDDVDLAHSKSVRPEGDGYRISLTANSRHWPTIKPVDVVLVLDHSGSMFAYLNQKEEMATPEGMEYDPDNPSRWAVLSKDIRQFGGDLFNGVNRSSVVTFYYKTTLHTFSQDSIWTDDEDEWMDVTVNNFNRNSISNGTNWVNALEMAREPVSQMNPNHSHVVLFVTDGHFTDYYGDFTNQSGDLLPCSGTKKEQPTVDDLKHSDCFDMSVDRAKELISLKPDLKFISIGVGNNVDVLKEFHTNVTGSEDGYYLGDDEIDLNDRFNQVTKSILVPLSIQDTLSENVDYDGSLRVTDGSGKAVPGSQYSADYDADSRTVNVSFNTTFTPVDGQTYTVSFRVTPSELAYDKTVAADGRYPDIGEPDTGQTSAGLPGLVSNDSATVTYTNQDTTIMLDYPKPVIQVTLPSWIVTRTGDCSAATVTAHLFKDGHDTGVSVDLAPDASHAFTNLLPGHKYELKADSAGDACTEPVIDTETFEPKSDDDTLTSVVDTDRIPAVVRYDPNGGDGNMPDVDGYVGDTPDAERNGFTNSDECVEFSGWNTSADGTGTAYQPKDQLEPLTADVTLYAQWRQRDGCGNEQGKLAQTGIGIMPLVLGTGLVALLGGGAFASRRSRRH